MFRRNRPSIVAHGPSLTLAGSIQLVSPCFLVPRVELGFSRVPTTTALVVATAGGTSNGVWNDARITAGRLGRRGGRGHGARSTAARRGDTDRGRRGGRVRLDAVAADGEGGPVAERRHPGEPGRARGRDDVEARAVPLLDQVPLADDIDVVGRGARDGRRLAGEGKDFGPGRAVEVPDRRPGTPPAPPTAQTSVAEIASTEWVPDGPLATSFHVVPLNCRVAAPGCSSPAPPTAKMSLALAAEMLNSVPSPETGDATTLQLVPLKCSMSWPPLPLPRPPTAQTSVGEMAVTEVNSPPPAVSSPLPFEASVGVAWTDQVVPLKNSTSGVKTPLLLNVSPTAKTLLLDEAETPLRTPVLSAGTVAADQVVPLKVSIRAPVSPLARVPEPTATTSVGEIAATAAGVKPETLVTTWKGPEAGVAAETTVTETPGEVLAS